MNSILDEALDEYEQSEIKSKISKLKIGGGDEDGDENEARRKEREDKERMMQLLDEMNNPLYGNVVKQTVQSLSTTSEGIKSVDNLFSSLNDPYHQSSPLMAFPRDPEDPSKIEFTDRNIAGTMQMLGNMQQGMEGFEPTRMEDAGETLMEDMMSSFEELGEKEDYAEAIDNVMRQLLSRDLMYDPIRQICNKYPEWLADHRPNLREVEYLNYGKQYQIFQKLLAVYDIEPDNFPRLMELMFDIQQYGQIPAAIIKQIAPGLQFDENGMPVMPNMGSGVMPEMPGQTGSGLPDLSELSAAMQGGQCCIS